MKYFDQHYRFLGDIINSNNKVENVLCELNTNIVDTNNMEVKLFPTDKSILPLISKLDYKKPIKVYSKDYYTSIYLETTFKNFSESELSGQYAIFNVNHFEEVERDFKLNKFKKLHLSFYIPSSSIFSRNRHFTNHYTKGILSGWIEKKEKHKINEEWTDERYTVKSNLGFFEVIPSFLFGDLNNEISNKKGKFLIDQIILNIDLKNKRGLNYNLINMITEEVDSYLRIISFLEGEFIKWNHIKITGKNKNTIIHKKSISRWISPLKNNFKDVNFYKRNRAKYLDLSSALFYSYKKINHDKRIGD